MSGFYPHDLLRVSRLECLDFEGAEVPAWVEASFPEAPWVVVRRSIANEGKVPVGIRGDSRSQRVAALLDSQGVLEQKRPFELRLGSEILKREPSRVSPALFQLGVLEDKWQIEFPWGPTGSVGFEIASGKAVTSSQSDLDLCIFAVEELSAASAQELLLEARKLAPRADISVETAVCAFSLVEYAAGQHKEILLRFPSGPRLGACPWQEFES